MPTVSSVAAAAAADAHLSNTTESAELVTKFESSLSLTDILPIPQRQYDKNRAPKLLGQPTVVYFHVTVLSLDSINEESMVSADFWGFFLCSVEKMGNHRCLKKNVYFDLNFILISYYNLILRYTFLDIQIFILLKVLCISLFAGFKKNKIIFHIKIHEHVKNSFKKLFMYISVLALIKMQRPLVTKMSNCCCLFWSQNACPQIQLFRLSYNRKNAHTQTQTYVTDIFLAQSWRDPRLRLPENMSEEYRILDVDWLHSIWRPDCFFKNAKKVTFHEMSIPNHYLWLYHDKTLLYMSKLTLVLSCAMKFESYPHDTQICSMMIESCELRGDFCWGFFLGGGSRK